MINLITYSAYLGICGVVFSKEAHGLLSQSNTIRNSDFLENFTLPVSTHFMCSVYSKIKGCSAFWVNSTAGTCSLGEIRGYWAYDPNGINVFVKTNATDGEELRNTYTL